MKSLRRWVAALVAMLVIAAIAVPLAWRSAADTVRSQVFVRMDDRAFTCANPDDVTTLPIDPSPDDDPQFRFPAVRAHPELDCSFYFFVVNESDQPVYIESILVPFMGADNGSGLHAGDADPNMIPMSGSQGIDAFYDFLEPSDFNSGAWEVPAGESMRWRLPLTWADGCVGSGAAIWVDDAPTVRVSAMGIGGDIVHAGPSYGIVGTSTSHC